VELKVSAFSVPVSATGDPVPSRHTTITMPRYLWHFDPDGWPVERIDTLTVEHVPVFTGGPQETLYPQEGGRPMACSFPKVSGVVLGLGLLSPNKVQTPDSFMTTFGTASISTPCATPQPTLDRSEWFWANRSR
jgi:hypothetical protein